MMVEIVRGKQPLQVVIDLQAYLRTGSPRGYIERALNRLLIYLQYTEIPVDLQPRFRKHDEIMNAYVAFSDGGELTIMKVPRTCLRVETWRRDASNERIWDVLGIANGELHRRFSDLYRVEQRREAVPVAAEPRPRKHRAVQADRTGTEERTVCGIDCSDDPGSPAEEGSVVYLYAAYACGSHRFGGDMMSGPHDHSMVVVDTETTGLIPPPVDVVVEIGAVVFHHGEFKGSYTSLIRPPDNYMNPRRLEICAKVSNITMAMLKNERTIDIVGDEFADWLAPFVKDGFQIQSFNKAFDRPMMDGVGVNMTTRLMMRHGVRPEWGECIMNAATAEIRRLGLNSTRSQMFTGSGRQVSYRTSLADAMAMLKIQPTAGKAHRADTDALHAAYVYQEILKRRQSRKIKFMNEGLE